MALYSDGKFDALLTLQTGNADDSPEQLCYPSSLREILVRHLQVTERDRLIDKNLLEFLKALVRYHYASVSLADQPT